MTRSYWQAFLTIFIIEFSVILASFWMLGDYEIRRFNFWPISEWMINYQAGFVRRGLVGEIIHSMNLQNGAIPFLNLLVLSFYYLFVVITIAIYRMSQVRDLTTLILILLIPGGIFHMGIGTIFYPRKEILFLIHFGLLCLIYLLVNRLRQSKQIKFIGLHLFGWFALLGGVLLTLVHEAYLFMAYPITALLVFILSQEQKHHFMKLYLAAYLILIPIIFILCSIYRGDAQIAQAIWDSYALSDRLVLAPAAPYTAAYATAGLGWAFTQHLSTIYGVFITGTWKYWLFFLIANTLTLFLIVTRIAKGNYQKNHQNIINTIRDSGLLQLTAISLLISSSMFLIASDYGRWIACTTNLTLFLLLTVSRSESVKNFKWSVLKFPRLLFNPFISFYLSIFALLCVLAYSLIFQMPECCISKGDMFIPYSKFINMFYQ